MPTSAHSSNRHLKTLRKNDTRCFPLWNSTQVSDQHPLSMRHLLNSQRIVTGPPATVCLCSESSFLIRHAIGTLFVQSFSYSYFCILSYMHYHSCTFQYTKGFKELCNQKISTQDKREEDHNLTHFHFSLSLVRSWRGRATSAKFLMNQW